MWAYQAPATAHEVRCHKKVHSQLFHQAACAAIMGSKSHPWTIMQGGHACVQLILSPTSYANLLHGVQFTSSNTAAAVSAVTQLNCRFQPPSTISISPLFSPKWLDNSNSKSNKSTTRPPSFLYLISSMRNGQLLGRGESYATTSGVCVPGGSLAIGLLWGQSWSQGAHRNPRISWKWEDAEFLLPSLVFFEKWETPDFLVAGNLKSCFHSQLKAEMLLTIMLLSTCPPKNSFKKQLERRRFRFKTWKLPILRGPTSFGYLEGGFITRDCGDSVGIPWDFSGLNVRLGLGRCYSWKSLKMDPLGVPPCDLIISRSQFSKLVSLGSHKALDGFASSVAAEIYTFPWYSSDSKSLEWNR